jgi:hypothetical protein
VRHEWKILALYTIILHGCESNLGDFQTDSKIDRCFGRNIRLGFMFSEVVEVGVAYGQRTPTFPRSALMQQKLV